MLQILFHDHFVWISSSNLGYQLVLPHDPLDLFVIHLRQSHFYVPPAILALTFVKDLLDFEIIVVVLAWLVRLMKPFIVSTSGDSRQFTKNSYIRFQFSDEPVFFIRPEFDSALLARSLAKKSFSFSRY